MRDGPRQQPSRNGTVQAGASSTTSTTPWPPPSQPSASFEARGLDDRRKAVDCIRKICTEQAEQLGREELEETKIGRLEHKIEKLKVIADRIPGVEFLRTEAFSGENGISLQEYAPFGVIGVITPVTHSLPTLACNAINMLAGRQRAGLQSASERGDGSPARACSCSTRRSTQPSASTT